MKRLSIFLLFLAVHSTLLANHLKGGWIFYEYLGPGAAANTSQYRVTVNQYLNCNSTSQQIDQEIYLGIFDAGTNTLVQKLTVPLSKTDREEKSSFDPCISPKPYICYRVDKYITTVTVTNNTAGYVLAVQRCCRIAGIVNVPNSNAIGVTYTNTLPGMVNGLPFYNDNSPVFAQKDTAVVCFNSNFSFDFSATDVDGDSLVYAFTEGIVGGGQGQNQARPDPPSNPPYGNVPYSSPYSGISPLGANVVIDRKTGIISGKAPAQTGDYVVAVVADEYRNGIMIGSTRKEIHVTVANCSLSGAQLNPTYISCDSYTFNFQNESTNPSVNSYLWDFGVPGSTTDTSTQYAATYTYADTGTYVLQLNVSTVNGCKDSAKAIVKVYPGFTPDFVVKGSCLQNPYRFFDSTKAKYGVVDSWRWDFGDDASTADTSRLQNPSYQYSTAAVRPVTLIVTSSKGCIDTVTKQVDVRDKPFVDLAFRDTLICSIDTLPLHVNGTGVFTWTPTTNMLNPNSADPLVFPKDTTVYKVTLNDNGCINTDSVKVNVLDSITVSLADTTICRTDSFRLQPVSYGLQYNWSPATGLSDATIKNPIAAPLTDITYQVVAHLGKCQASTSARVKVVPYPQAHVFPDTSICYGSTITLRGSIVGSSFAWSPPNSLAYANTLTPVAGPQQTTAYVLAAYDTLGCPKPGYDTALIKVIPPVQAFAGNDTIVVTGQPLQLNATGGTYYYWTPAIDLNNRSVANPIAVFDASLDSITYVVRAFTPEGCYGDDSIKIKIFRPNPEVYVPSGFTPNSDGRNDVLRPIAPGIKQLKYFRVFNRWGQLLFSTSETGKGWDGTYEGKPQPSGTYVYMLEAIDYLGKVIVRKGTSVLIR